MMKKLLIVLALTGFYGVSVAQSNDTSVFFQYASTFDQLAPQNIHVFGHLIPDTTAQKEFAPDLRELSLEKSGTYSVIIDKDANVTHLNNAYYRWDGNGRLINFHTTSYRDTIPIERVHMNYLIAWKASDASYRYEKESDSVIYTFNRAGAVATQSFRTYRADTTIIRTVQYLYDAQGRVIVATNMFYGPLLGTYTYLYDRSGMLTRRTFNAGGSGIVLCTDTIEYSYQLASQSIMIATHKLKVAGMEKWALLESKTYYPATGVILSYSDYNDADTNFYYQNYPEYTIRYEYDEKGRRTAEYFGNTIQSDIFSARYYYSKYDQPDSIIYSETTIEPKAKYTRVISRDVRTYNSNGRLMSRKISIYEYGDRKKKFIVQKTEVYELNYRWQ